MRIIIIGGGKLGYNIASHMIDRNYSVKIIEKNKDRCIKIANELNAEVICGDGTEIEVLSNVGAHKADCLIAVTGLDQDNLVASQLADKKFKVAKIIIRDNNPKNLEALRKLGSGNIFSSTEIIANLIEQEIESVGVKLLTTLNEGRASIFTLIIPPNSVLDGTLLKDTKLPKSSLIISIVRNGELIIPNGETYILTGDEIIVICEDFNQKELTKRLSEIKK